VTATLDHLVWGVPHLGKGIAEFEGRTGVNPVEGGSHPEFGTHNALASLGPDSYLELLALDPEHTAPPVGLGTLVETMHRPALVTFAARVDFADALAGRARSAGLTAEVITGSRDMPHGETLEWRNVVLGNHRFAESMPFFIEWGHGTTHPAESSPPGCTLASLEVRHPDADALRDLFAALGLSVAVHAASRPGIVAALDTPNGTVVLT
jgi:hypothetical protein